MQSSSCCGRCRSSPAARKKELGEICTLADELSLPEGTTLIEEGKQGHEFFVLVDGEVDVRAKGRKLKASQTARSSARWRSSRQRPRNATVTATSPVRVLVVHESGVPHACCTTRRRIQLKVLQTLADRAAENALA